MGKHSRMYVPCGFIGKKLCALRLASQGNKNLNYVFGWNAQVTTKG